MLTTLSQFDPISFFAIDTSSYAAEEAETLRTDLMKQIGEYILLSFVNEIPNETLQRLAQETDGNTILSQLQSIIPNFDTRMLAYVEQFKNEYQALETEQSHA